MDPDRRQRLEAKRRELREELATREQVESVRHRTAVLDELGVAYDLVLDDRDIVEWMWAHFPTGGGLLSARIDWGRVATWEAGPDPLAGDAELGAWLARLRDGVAPGDGGVVLMTGNGVNPGIRVSWADVVAHPPVVSSDGELWVVCRADGWVIEYTPYHEGWRWGRASRQPEAS